MTSSTRAHAGRTSLVHTLFSPLRPPATIAPSARAPLFCTLPAIVYLPFDAVRYCCSDPPLPYLRPPPSPPPPPLPTSTPLISTDDDDHHHHHHHRFTPSATHTREATARPQSQLPQRHMEESATTT